jgi:hypothetical protein
MGHAERQVAHALADKERVERPGEHGRDRIVSLGRLPFEAVDQGAQLGRVPELTTPDELFQLVDQIDPHRSIIADGVAQRAVGVQSATD